MSLDFTKATKQQLLTIISEVCPMDYKYRAAFELLKRKESEKTHTITNYKRMSSFSGKSYRVQC